MGKVRTISRALIKKGDPDCDCDFTQTNILSRRSRKPSVKVASERVISTYDNRQCIFLLKKI